MESLIEQFVRVDSGDYFFENISHTYRDDYGYKDKGRGSGYGIEDDYVGYDGYGDGVFNGDGCGIGFCFGIHAGSGNGSGGEHDRGFKSINGKKIYRIDDEPTIIESVHANIASGFVVRKDLSLEPCYVARYGNFFAHGTTIREAVEDAKDKAFQNEPIEQRIERFKAKYPTLDATASNFDLFDWHNILTGSCKLGRKQFAKEHDIDIIYGSMTIREFIDLTKGEYGGSVIKELEETYKA